MDADVETDFDAATGAFCIFTVACGMPAFGPAELAGTRAVSFLLSERIGAGAIPGEAGAEAEGGFTAVEGAGGAGGLIPPTDGGLGGPDGAELGAVGGLGAEEDGAAGAEPPGF